MMDSNSTGKPVDLSTRIGSLRLKNPVILASGTCGYGAELSDMVDLAALGAVVVKGISLEPRQGNPPPRIVETPCGLLNAIGLENIGVEAFLKTRMPWLREHRVTTFVNVLGNSIEEYKRVVAKLSDEPGISAIEVNISCPNVKEGGLTFGTSPEGAFEVTKACVEETDHPVIVKLSPNVTDIRPIAQAVSDAGAHGISLINTVLGMAIDIEKGHPQLANIFGGLSGPAIKPIALRMVWEAVRVVHIPVIGIGGITSYRDAIEFLMAGAVAIQIGTGTLVDPRCSQNVLDGIQKFMQEKGYRDIKSLRITVP